MPLLWREEASATAAEQTSQLQQQDQEIAALHDQLVCSIPASTRHSQGLGKSQQRSPAQPGLAAAACLLLQP